MVGLNGAERWEGEIDVRRGKETLRRERERKWRKYRMDGELRQGLQIERRMGLQSGPLSRWTTNRLNSKLNMYGFRSQNSNSSADFDKFIL